MNSAAAPLDEQPDQGSLLIPALLG